MTSVTFRRAHVDDVPAIVSLFLDDPHGTGRDLDSRSPESFRQAFEALETDPNNLIVVADDEGRVVGSMQITFVANLRFEGGRRALIEAVRVAGSHQGQGLGRKFMQHAIDLSKERGCTLVQLNSNRKRTEAIRFYEGLGFEPTHVGFELYP
ncbi:MAG: GNAT family N-acetyltransferase [Pseudomonadota bacterium]